MSEKLISGIPAKQWHQNYYKENINKFVEYRNKYQNTNRDKLKSIFKIYYHNNREEILIKSKEYREKNKDTLMEYSRKQSKKHYMIKIDCSCGKQVAKKNYKKHLTTNLHEKVLKEKQLNKIVYKDLLPKIFILS